MKHSHNNADNSLRWEYLPQIGSTNEEALRQIAQNEAYSGKVIYTFNQTQGRGQRDKSWSSEPGKNLAMTYIFLPKSWPAQNTFIINQIVALTIEEVLSKYVNEVKIKWPNDIYVGPRKIAGILIQTAMVGKNIKEVVIGIGLNMDQTQFHPNLPNPTSLAIEFGKSVSKERLLHQISQSLDEKLRGITIPDHHDIHEQYQSKLFLIDTPADFLVDGASKRGTIIGVDRTGRLQVRFDENTSSFLFGQIQYDTSGTTNDRG